ncbi:MAG: anti-sigma factor domain-containing protein [Burkholderiaceae bacterium]
MNWQAPEDRVVASGEYVLGTLDAAELAAFEAQLANDIELQAEVYRWQDRLLGLGGQDLPTSITPPPWADIESRLRQSLDMAQTAAAVGQPLRLSAMAAASAANDALFARLRLWQTTGSLALAACAVLASLLVFKGSAPTPPAAQISASGNVRYVTMLQGPDQPSGWLVEVIANDRLRLVPVGPAMAVPSGKALQFWTKLDGAAGPTSLGLVKPGQAIEIPLSKLPGVGEKQLFELTLEPEAGSPIDKPTGPILFVGRSVRL